jgi:hypothetical protein
MLHRIPALFVNAAFVALFFVATIPPGAYGFSATIRR